MGSRSMLGRVAGFFWRAGPQAAEQQPAQQQALQPAQQQALRIQQPPPAPLQQQVPADAPAPAANIYDKAAQIRYGCDSTPCEGVDPHQLSNDLANTVVWSGGCCTDYLFYVSNWHAFLGIFFSHPQHPWTKVARVAAHFVSCSLLLFTTSLTCVTPEENGEGIIPTIQVSWVAIIMVTLFDIVYGLYLYHVSVMNTLCCGYCKDNAVVAGTTRLCQCAALSSGVACGIFTLFLSMVLVLTNTSCQFEDQISLAARSRLRSYLLWFPMMLLMPCCGYVWRWQGEIQEYHKMTQLAAVEASSQAAMNMQAFPAPAYGGYAPQQAVYAPPQQAYMQPQAYAMHQQPPHHGPAAGQALYAAR